MNNTSESAVTLKESFKVWTKIALLSFGGPAGQIAVMHKTIVDEKKWISEARFLNALNYCMLLPGPEAQQLAIYIGWIMHRWVGGLIAGILFILPGFLSILALSVAYSLYQNVDFVNAVFFGLKPAVISIVIAALIRIGSKTLKTPAMVVIATLSFIALFFFGIPFPIVILVSAAIGYWGGRTSPKNFEVPHPHASHAESSELKEAALQIETGSKPSMARSFAVIAIFGTLWWAPVLTLYFLNGPQNVFTQQGLFFSKAAIVTFGGAYAVLAYIAQQAVENYQWLKPNEMIDGLGMAETTPGPLIQVVQFVGFMGAFRAAESGVIGYSPVTAGVLASILTTWVTFLPCFLWIFLGAPYIEYLRNNKSLSRTLTAITAAVVGVILNLAIWFSLHVIFNTVVETQYGPLKIHTPDITTLDWKSLLLAVAAAILTFSFKYSMLKVIGISVLLGAVLYFV